MDVSRHYLSSNTRPSAATAELVLTNGRFYTVDDATPWADAVAISQGRFIAVGSADQVAAHIGEHTRVVDLGGRFVMPGLYDMHTHPDLALAPGYAGYLDVGLEDPTPEQVSQAILSYADQHPGDGWIYGAYFVRYTFKQAGIVPDRAWLDSIVSDRPVAILDRSWGCMLVNSMALELAAIDVNTPDPRHGYIERDGITGEPTGILVDGAYAMIHAAMPPTPAHALQRAYREGVQFQSGRGVVGTKFVHVCEHRLDALRTIDQQGQLTVRVEAAISWQDDIFPVKRRWELIAGERHFYRSARLNANAVKFHFDGTHESRSSYLSTPWAEGSAWRGHLNLTPEHINDMVADMDRKGIRVIAHCTGDGASDLFLDAVAEARRRNGGQGMRHQCAHSTTLLDANLQRFSELDVIAEFSPVGWFPSSFAYARAVFGEERMQRAYNFKGVLDAGGVAVMGTDWPVSSLDPWIGFEAMVTRENPWEETDASFYGEPISLEQAIRVMTINGAWAMGIEHQAGSISVGKSADLIVLDRNLFEVAPRGNIHATQVDLTMLEGEFVWDAQGEFSGTVREAVWQRDIPEF
ncbi:amidohydrolase [Halomonas denitrificans]|uniref:amidohydrolase n=1 Tax=Halomonas TaxID=2745 RepID=UPI001A8D22D4|nr:MULTISPECIES: amidohydrolase [Halomonas]MED5294281.1 amidohydrolase [Pseudomonadota bacterium]MBN8413372.1 amidohydrolase [Halomonas litopenaei]MBY5924057.1 amidohydrolase [Halomonas sp. DP4Y7-2]MBY5967241.1 amidohydrolase [Halomonas denitrificans]MBY6029284.1 amidohydrolase [Halomonas sp. DP8Y7-1]